MRNRPRPFAQVDVFSSQPYRGNPVAVILEAEGLTDEQMLQIARWTNLSETTILLPATTAEADYRARIFTQTGEIPFAGHPTLGSARAWLEAGGEPPRVLPRLRPLAQVAPLSPASSVSTPRGSISYRRRANAIVPIGEMTRSASIRAGASSIGGTS